MIQNMRDLGGLLTKDNKIIRSGMLVRSANLSRANRHDLDGISTVIDLRNPGERKEAPDKTHRREYLTLPILDDSTAGISHEEETDESGFPDMAKLYRNTVRDRTASIRNVLLAIMRHNFSDGAILWHCSEGKDRCGLTTALVLEALGVDRDTIMVDYLKTNEVNLPKAIRLHDQVLSSHGPAYAESIYRVYIADEKYLRAAWDAMGENYLTEKLEIPEETLSAFRETVLENGF